MQETEKRMQKKKFIYRPLALLRFSFFMRLRCHFQRICLFFFHRRELLFMVSPS
ncbi:MAG: hypothetical protein QT04_C0043G0006 [archaeon GW2011_AR11]|nr:MAG: hypothetical protein QT04_C0043G0006 [archaeon GW2011_AR11]